METEPDSHTERLVGEQHGSSAGTGIADISVRNQRRRNQVVLPVVAMVATAAGALFIASIFMQDPPGDRWGNVSKVVFEWMGKPIPMLCVMLYTILIRSWPARNVEESLVSNSGDDEVDDAVHMQTTESEESIRSEAGVLATIKREATVYFRCIFTGQLLGVIGDMLLLLAHFLDGSAVKTVFISGALSFFLGHIFYIYAFVRGHTQWLLLRWIPSLVLFAAAVVLIIPETTKLGIVQQGLLVVYALIESTMVWRAFCRVGVVVIHGAVERKSTQWAGAAGAFVFMISDMTLAYNMLVQNLEPAGGVVIMLTYWFGQLGIATTVHRSPFRL